MSLVRLDYMLSPAPYALREQVLSYARTVKEAAPDIFRDTGIKYDSKLGNDLIFIAGLRKLYGIFQANFWILDYSLTTVKKSEMSSIKIGGTVYTKSSPEYRKLRSLIKELNDLLSLTDLLEVIEQNSYSEILRALTNGS